MFTQFPKNRPDLPATYQHVYVKHILENRKGSTTANSISARFEQWLHHQVAADVKTQTISASTLELGCGGLNHLAYEPPITAYDVVEPFEDLLASAVHKDRVRHIFPDINKIPPDYEYSRIISIAVLEHLTDLPQVIARSGLLLKADGCFRAGIPNEGHWPWHLAYRITTGLEFRLRYNLDYEILMRHEHLNTADEIEAVLGYFFQHVKVSWLGITKNLALYRYFECSQPEKSKCADFLAKTPGEENVAGKRLL